MNMATVAEVGRTPSAILSRREPSIITNNGHAQNVVINVSGMDIDEVVDLARNMQAKAALQALRRDARVRGLDSLPLQDVDDEVADVRDAR